jgi:putative nucleotidyltransferase with HDIG domain
LTENISAKELVKKNIRLFSLPEVCLQVQSMAGEPGTSMEMIGKVVSQDAALTARLLKIVNSPYYGFQSRIDTITRALSIVGTKDLIDLTLAFSVVEVFNKIPEDLIDMVTFWRHSVFCGLLAQRIAAHCHVLHGERLFIAGLLHDVGKLLVYYNYPDKAAKILAEQKSSGTDICQLEHSILGSDHAEIGGELLTQWNLPEALREAVAYHHAPEECPSASLESSIVHIANALTNYLETLGQQQATQYYDPYALFLGLNDRNIVMEPAELNVNQAAWEVTRLDHEKLGPIIEDASLGFEEVLQTLYPF